MAVNNLTVYKEGNLSKRQRGLNDKRAWIGKPSLKFQERYFVLTSDKLLYRAKKDGSEKGYYPVNRIQVIETIEDKVFNKSYVFQVGDDDEILYLMAGSGEERWDWISTLQLVALKNGNLMLDAFHKGVFNKKWTCCGGLSRDCSGCIATNKYGDMESSKSKRIVQAEDVHRHAVRDRHRQLVQSVIVPGESPSNHVDADNRLSLDVTRILVSEQQVVADSEQVTDEKQVITDGEQVIADGKQVVADGEHVTDGEQVTDGKQVVTDGEQDVTDGKQVVTNGEQVITDDGKLVTDDSGRGSSVPPTRTLLQETASSHPSADQPPSALISESHLSIKKEPSQTKTNSPMASPKLDKKGSPKASPKLDKKGSPKASPKLNKKGSPKASPELDKKGSPKASPKLNKKGSPKAYPKLDKKGSPKASPKLDKKGSPKVSPKLDSESSSNLIVESDATLLVNGCERRKESEGLLNVADQGKQAGSGVTPLAKRTSKILNVIVSGKDSQFENGFSPLHMAIRDGSIDQVNRKLDLGADIELPTAAQLPVRPLELAFSCDHYHIMEVLLMRGADPNGVNPRDNTTVLHTAAEKGSTKAVLLLIRFNCDINIKNGKGDTPLHIASRHGHSNVVEILLKNNCLFNEVNNSCRNPLHEAAECGAIDVAKLLVKAGTNPLVRETCYNATPYILAHKAQKMDMCDLLKGCLPDNQQPYCALTSQDSAHFGCVEFLVFSTANTLVSAGGDTQVSVWRIVDGELANESVISTGETILALSQHEGVVIVGSMDVHIFTASDPSTQRRMYLEIGDPKDPPLLVVGFTPTGQLAVAGTDDHSNEVKLLPKVSSVEDFPTTPSSSFHVGDNPSCVYSLAISPVGGVHVMAVSVQPGTLFKADGNKLVHLVDYTSGQHLHTIDIGKGGVQVSLNMAFSPDGGNLAIACVDVVSIWSVETGKLLRTIAPKDSSSVNCLCYSPTSPHIAVGCQEGKVKVYSTKEWTLLFELQSQQEEIASVAFSLDGCLLATGCKDGSIALWKTET